MTRKRFDNRAGMAQGRVGLGRWFATSKAAQTLTCGDPTQTETERIAASVTSSLVIVISFP